MKKRKLARLMKQLDLARIVRITMLKQRDGIKEGTILDVKKCEVIYNSCISGKKPKNWLYSAIRNGVAKPHIRSYPWKS